MSSTQKRTLGFALWLALAGSAFRPIAPLERGLGVLLAPLRVVSELASPLWLVRAPEARAAERDLLAAWAAEARAGEELLEALAHFATPRDPALIEGRRLVHAEVVGRGEAGRDVLRVRLRDARGVEPGLPVVSGAVFVGRVQRVEPEADPATGGLADVELVTSPSFHVGARAEDEALGVPIDMTVGGLDVGRESRASGRVALAIQSPSDRALGGGLARVHERLPEVDPHARLAEGYRLGRVRREGEERWVIDPELDYQDGLFHVVVLAHPDAALPSDEPLPQTLADLGWRRVRPLSHGDPSPWREAVRIAAGTVHGVEPGAALAFGARFVGRAGSAGPWISDALLLGDAGLSVVAVARFEEDGEPRVLGRLVSLGRDADGAVRFRASGGEPLPLAADGPDGCRSARLFTGSGDPGVPSGLYLGEARVPVDPPDTGSAGEPGAGARKSSAGPRIVRLPDAPAASNLRGLWVRVESSSELAGASADAERALEDGSHPDAGIGGGIEEGQ